MKRLLLIGLTLMCAAAVNAQTTYYWVGGAAVSPASISTGSNWNTALNGSGSPRSGTIPTSGGSDILIFDGANYGGATLTTGLDSVNLNASISCWQMKFLNGANIVFIRNGSASGGTSTLIISGSTGDDFIIDATSALTLGSYNGSTVLSMASVCTGVVSGKLNMITSQQARIANSSGGAPGSLVFSSGAAFRSNITGSSSYPFGNNTQSSEKWVVFQSGSTLYYEGGNSPMGSSAAYMPVDFKPGSNFVMKSSNPVGTGGVYFNRKSFPNLIVESGVTLTADGPIYRIDTLTINSGGSFITHTSGQTVILGDVIVNGSLSAGTTSTNELLLAGDVQSISGAGTFAIPSLLIASNANVTLKRNIIVNKTAIVYGKLDLSTSQITGAGTFIANAATIGTSGTGNLVAGSYALSVPLGTFSIVSRGLNVSGTGMSAGTAVVSYYTSTFPNPSADTLFLSKPIATTGSNISLTFSSPGATLATNNANGFDPATGSITLTDTKTYQNGISYIINAATNSPFGISANTTTGLSAKDVTLNAAATTNASLAITGALQLGAKLTVRAMDTLRLASGASLTGNVGATNYIITAKDGSGNLGKLRRDGIVGSTLFPIGTAANYLPVTLSPTSTSDFTAGVFEGITAEGTPNGTPFTTQQLQTVVNAVWDINRVSGTGSSDVQLQWTDGIEGSTFTTFANSDIGFILHNGTTWSAPIGTGNNTTNTATNTFSSFGKFSLGARPPANPFLFNPIPAKTYGNPDFSAGVVSANTSMPINYTSSNTAVATIVAGQIHIVGAGTAIITATQASDGFYPAANVSQTLTVNKANLTITANNISKPEGNPNPAFTVSYNGFVNGETASVLIAPVVITTTATTASLPGTYPITPSGATAANYNITFINGTLTVIAKTVQTITFAAPATKTYGAADFGTGASTTSGLALTYNSSNPAVATVTGNTIHIVGAGTTIITASQGGNDQYFAATSVARTLTVNKANLTVKVFDTTKVQGEVNPQFRTSITGFVNGETVANLTTAPTVTTDATTTSAPGYYSLSIGSGISNNYNFVYTNARLTILPPTGSTELHIQAYRSASNQLRVRIYSPLPDLADVAICDLTGRPLIIRNIFLPVGFGTTEFTVNALPSGIYIIRVVGKTTVLTKTVSITR
ncbi:MAG: type sorting protein [Flaviaesturariibacter sp.]|nr:type sorting protein [Flaviaesturariibacter sp.]